MTPEELDRLEDVRLALDRFRGFVSPSVRIYLSYAILDVDRAIDTLKEEIEDA